MIKFFRRIREQLLAENKFSKYLFYSIGEIILVVIGILIALQINTWSENKRERESELSILTEIRNNLKYDLIDFESNLIQLQNKMTSSKSLLKILNSEASYSDSLGYFFSYLSAYPHFTSKTNGYTLLKSKGLDLILNDSLRNSITDLYEDQYNYLLTYEYERINYNKTFLETAMAPYMGIKELSVDVKPNSIVIKDKGQILTEFGYFRNIRNFKQLKDDEDFHGMIKNVEIWSSALESIHRSVKNDVIDLIGQIENELENRNE